MADSVVVSSVNASTDMGDFMLAATDSVAAAMACLRRNGCDVAVVTDDHGLFAGTVTDSDIRRFALVGGRLESPVAAVMSAKPVVAAAGLSDQDVLQLLRSHRVRSVPVIEQGRVVGVRSMDGFPYWSAPPSAVIMAGGRGQRLRPVTDKVPKPLLKVGSTSIIERIIGDLASAGVLDVYLAVNYKAEIFEERLGFGEHLGVNLHYLREETAMGTAGALSLLPDQQGPVLVTNGDIVTTVDFARLFDYHWRHGGAVTIAGVEHLSPIPYGVLRTAEHHLISIEEKPERRDLCSAGIYVLQPEVLGLMPPSDRVDMPDLIAEVLDTGLPVHVFPILEKWFDIGGTAEFERVLVQFAIGEEY
ncbi:MAG: nucleotidyltransferase family protein [Actinomycetota bacterium]|nr:nucleotidyltransferase family protein [Actinomycetota bacterium]